MSVLEEALEELQRIANEAPTATDREGRRRENRRRWRALTAVTAIQELLAEEAPEEL